MGRVPIWRSREFIRAKTDSGQGGIKMRVVDRCQWKKLLVCCLVTVALLTAIPNGFAAELAADPPAFTPDSNAGRSTIPEVFKELDVTVLHALILNKILGITQEAQEKQTNLVYVKSYEEAIKSTSTGANQMVFILNPTLIGQVKAVAEAGEVMPQKSTYFYPKLLTGLVLNIHDTPGRPAGA